MIDEHKFNGSNAWGPCTECDQKLEFHAPEGGWPSWAPEVFLDGGWSGNALRFTTKEGAERWARELLYRWFVPTDSRAVGSMDSPNYIMLQDGQIAEIKKEVVET